MEYQSPFLAIRRVEQHIKTLLRSVDTDLLEVAEKRTMAGLRRMLVDTRLDLRDYELSETREEQLKCAAAARKRLQKLQKAILAAGPAFGPADVAQLSAQLEQIEGEIL